MVDSKTLGSGKELSDMVLSNNYSTEMGAVGQLSQRTIDVSLSQLNVTAYIETQLVPFNVLDNIIQTTMKEFHLKA
ncbi:unnamed protein product [Adineta steineri]|uniref:Uncharacterized protein n=1 Tax=Adineta steineri TaxID=433720 RepID=A0A814EL79_9BILA|nr:unnamed protein product [Adineta steineri]